MPSLLQLPQAVTANPTDLNLASVVAHLPKADPTGKNSFSFPYAEAQALGLLPATMNLKSGYVGFASTVSWDFKGGVVPAGQYDFMGVAAHEISEAMGRISALSTANPAAGSPLRERILPDEPGQRSAAKLLTRDEARRIAVNIHWLRVRACERVERQFVVYQITLRSEN